VVVDLNPIPGPLASDGPLLISGLTGGQISPSFVTESVAKPTGPSVSAEILGLLYPCTKFYLLVVFSKDCWQHSQDEYSRYY